MLDFIQRLKAKNFDCKNVVVKVPDEDKRVHTEVVLERLKEANLIIPTTALVFAARQDDVTAYRIMWRKDMRTFSKWYLNELKDGGVNPVRFHDFARAQYAA